MSKTQPARGMRDFLPSDVRKRNYVIGIIKEVYEKYGFEPLETPSVENLETLTGKYGEEGNQLMFKILKRGEKLQDELAEGKIVSENQLSDLALRYDLTVPLARVVANYRSELPKFFKRYQIQPVWRADRPAKGRFREFYQCDVDAIGSTSMLVEAELISAVSEIFERLGFEDFIVRINDREILRAILDTAGVPTEKQTNALIALDKLDKIGREGVAKEFIEKGISNESEIKLLTFFDYFIKDLSNEVFEEASKKNLINLIKTYNLEVKTFSDAKFVLSTVNKSSLSNSDSREKKEENVNLVIKYLLLSFEEYDKIISELETSFEKDILIAKNDFVSKLFSEIKNVTVGQMIAIRPLLSVLQFLHRSEIGVKAIFTLVKLLKLTDATSKLSHIFIDPTLARGLSYYTGAILEINVPDFAGSLGGGGRYDGLIGMFGKEQIPAVGFSIGLERILVVMEQRGMFPENLTTNSADVMITNWSDETASESLKLAGEIRAKGLRVLVYPEADKLGKQFKYADSINIPFVCVLGESELAENKVTVKNLKSGEQETVSREEVLDKLKG